MEQNEAGMEALGSNEWIPNFDTEKEDTVVIPEVRGQADLTSESLSECVEFRNCSLCKTLTHIPAIIHYPSKRISETSSSG